MDNENRPHSRKKTVGSGSAHVGKGDRVDTGSRPVGSGGRPNGGSYNNRGNDEAAQRALPFKLNLKTILFLGVIVILALIILPKLGLFSGGGSAAGGSVTSSVWDGASSVNSNTGNNASSASIDMNVSSKARDRFYTPETGDTVTIMVYMCGTDLESKYGMATSDLSEMAKANLSDNINLIVETGGCSKWKTQGISSSCNQIYRVKPGKLVPVEKDFGNNAMTDPNNLTKFIQYCKKNFAADRYMLIFWDHGGGSISGFGYDEKNKNAGSMTLAKINTALKNADVKFDFIGFDACLMATLETDLVCNSYADYMIASEESEPGTGWYYTNWLNQLSEDTATPTVELAKTIIDNFVSASCAAQPNAQVTLSVVDLAELDGTVPDALRDFAASTNELVKSDDYKKVSDARAGTRQFAAKSRINQIDLVDFATRVNTKEAKALAEVLKGCVKYNKTTISNSYGISMYFPYETTNSVKSAIASYDEIGKESDYSECMDEYTQCIKSFASLGFGGQIASAATQSGSSGGMDIGSLLGSLISSSSSSSSSSSPISLLGSLFGGSSSGSSSSSGGGLDVGTLINLLGAFSGRSMPEELDWVDTELIAQNAESIANQCIDPTHITASEKNGTSVLSLSEEEWSLIQTVELSLYAYDGEGYLDLGLDNVFEFDDDGDLLLDFDGTWMTLNGHVCAYYLVSDTEQADGTYVTVGKIPALLNGELVNLQVVFDKYNEYGAITGAYPMYEDGKIDVLAKGDASINVGDKLQLICDYYTPQGDYESTYTLGEAFTVTSDGFTLENLTLEGAERYSAMYRLTDIYGNYYWLPIE